MSKPAPGSLKSRRVVKNKGKKVIRNVLTLRSNTYWPLVPEDEISNIEKICQEHLKILNSTQPKVPWYIMMKLTKELRKAKIKEEFECLPLEDKEKILLARKARNHVSIGVNTTVRSIEQNKLLFCLIDPSEYPKMVVEKLLILSQEKLVPTGLVPNLKDILKPIIGFSTLVLGFKKTLLEEDCCIKGCAEIKNILQQLNFTLSVKSDVKNVTESIIKESQKTLKQKRLSDIYLYRTSTQERVFRPTSENIPKSEYQFIEVTKGSSVGKRDRKKFNRYTDVDSKKKESLQIFDSPLILTLQNNPNKRKKK